MNCDTEDIVMLDLFFGLDENYYESFKSIMSKEDFFKYHMLISHMNNVQYGLLKFLPDHRYRKLDKNSDVCYNKYKEKLKEEAIHDMK